MSTVEADSLLHNRGSADHDEGTGGHLASLGSSSVRMRHVRGSCSARTRTGSGSSYRAAADTNTRTLPKSVVSCDATAQGTPCSARVKHKVHVSRRAHRGSRLHCSLGSFVRSDVVSNLSGLCLARPWQCIVQDPDKVAVAPQVHREALTLFTHYRRCSNWSSQLTTASAVVARSRDIAIAITIPTASAGDSCMPALACT